MEGEKQGRPTSAGDEDASGTGGRPIPYARLFFSLMRVGATAFGGPAMIAYIREMAVVRRQWLDEKAFRGGVVLCQSIPGATAMQTAAFVGLRLRGVPGGVATYAGFGLPGFFLMLAFSVAYSHAHDLPLVLALFRGLRAIVVALVANAALTFGRSSLRRARDYLLAGAAAAALLLELSPILVIVGAGAAGAALLAEEAPGEDKERPAPQFGRALRSVTLLLLAAGAGLAALWLLDRPLFELALIMLRADLFAFGGGFASIPLLQQQLVTARHWVDARTFMDGIALGQVTPGPIVITATFVGYLLRGFPGALVATVSIFLPSFVMLALTLPLFDWLQGSAAFRKAVRGALLAFVGLLLWATIHFAQAVEWRWQAALLAGGGLIALQRKVDVLWVVLAGSVLALLLR